MVPNDPASAPDRVPRPRSTRSPVPGQAVPGQAVPGQAVPGQVVPGQAMARGGTVVRPGAVAWGEAPGAAAGAYASCEAVEQVLASVVKDAELMNDLLDELARARVWVPLPGGGLPVTDGSSVALPTVTYLGAEFVPCFTSIQRVGTWPDSPAAGGQHRAERRHGARYAGDRTPPHIVVPAAALARRLPPGIGIALNPGAEASVPVYPEGIAHLAATAETADGGVPIRMGHPPDEPEALLREVRSGLHDMPAVRAASRAWLSVTGQGEGLVISVALDDPASAPAHEAVVGIIERAVAAIPHQAPFPIDVTFPGEAEPDLVDDWVSNNTHPFYLRD